MVNLLVGGIGEIMKTVKTKSFVGSLKNHRKILKYLKVKD